MATLRQRAGVKHRRFSKEEYYRLGELGFFRGQRVELIEGRIVVLSPQDPIHADMVDLVAEALRTLFGAGYRVRPQLPLDLGQTTEPEPDLVVVAGAPRQFQTAHPTTAALLVEVSNTTLGYDRRHKGSLYARAGVADYWIINVVDRQLEVYRDPVPDPSQPFGWRYNTQLVLVPPATVAPLAVPNSSISVAELL